MVILESKSIESSEETAEKLLESNNSQNKSHDDLLVVSDKAYTLNFDKGRDVTTFTVEIEKDGNYTFFTEHMPFEFEAASPRPLLTLTLTTLGTWWIFLRPRSFKSFGLIDSL